MANDETRAAGNFKERFSYPKDATMRVVRQLEGELDEARAELDRLRAANAELVAAIQKYSVYAQARGSAPFGTTAEEQAALARHDAGKGGGE